MAEDTSQMLNYYDMPNEDDYWENIRERMENPVRHSWDGTQETERDLLSLDDLAEDIEAEYKCDVSKLCESDLIDIVAKQTGVAPLMAKYDEQYFCIDYRY